MASKKKKIHIFLSISLVLFSINEIRFLIFGSFGFPPLPSSGILNCGDEYRFELDAMILSKDDLYQFIVDYYYNLTDKYGNEYLEMYAYAGNNTWLPPEEVDWTDVVEYAAVGFNGAILQYQTVYTIGIPCIGHLDMKITQFGSVSVYGCCGI